MKLISRVTVIAAMVVMVMSVNAFAAGEDAKSEIDAVKVAVTKAFPRLTIDAVNKTGIDGFYELVAGANIIYYHKNSGNIFFGEIYAPDGKNITAARRDEIAAEGLKSLPLDKAIKIGNGKNTVIEFADIDCPFCRKTEEAFKNRDDVTRYVFLFPLQQIHPKSTAKALDVLCQSKNDRAQSYLNAMAGEIDHREPKACENNSASELLQEYTASAGKLGIRGLPSLWVNGTRVAGADIAKIEQLLGKAGDTR